MKKYRKIIITLYLCLFFIQFLPVCSHATVYADIKDAFMLRYYQAIQGVEYVGEVTNDKLKEIMKNEFDRIKSLGGYFTDFFIDMHEKSKVWAENINRILVPKDLLDYIHYLYNSDCGYKMIMPSYEHKDGYFLGSYDALDTGVSFRFNSSDKMVMNIVIPPFDVDQQISELAFLEFDRFFWVTQNPNYSYGEISFNVATPQGDPVYYDYDPNFYNYISIVAYDGRMIISLNDSVIYNDEARYYDWYGYHNIWIASNGFFLYDEILFEVYVGNDDSALYRINPNVKPAVNDYYINRNINNLNDDSTIDFINFYDDYIEGVPDGVPDDWYLIDYTDPNFEFPPPFDDGGSNGDNGDDNGDSEINWEPLKINAMKITNKFPFSLPWDIKKSFESLADDGQIPKFKIDLTDTVLNVEYEIDLTMWDNIAKVFRGFILVGFDIGLILLTRRLMGGGV